MRKHSKLVPSTYSAQEKSRYYKKYKRYLEKCIKTLDRYIKELDRIKYGR